VPVDWTILLYFAVGFMQILIWLMYLMNANRAKALLKSTQSEPTSAVRSAGIPFQRNQFIGMSLFFLLIGISMPLSEQLFPLRYPVLAKEQELSRLLENQQVVKAAGSQADRLRLFAGQQDTIIARGRALFPRYYLAGQGEPKTSKAEYVARNYPRLNFSMVGQLNGPVVFPLRESPATFPNSADVTVIGCQGRDYFTPVAVLVDSSNTVYLSSQSIPTSCGDIQNK
jgi:hypothetical protein